MAFLIEILAGAWMVLGEMAPYLLLGFLVAGALSVWISPAFIERHLGQRGIRQVAKAALFGVPIPLCSCGVIPVSTSLYRHGASKGSTVAFLSSTPQTGVDSILVTYGLLGPVFTVFRVVAAFVTGLVSGTAVDIAEGHEDERKGNNNQPSGCCHGSQKQVNRWREMIRYGFVTLPKDIGMALLVGLVITGLIGAIVPEGFFSDHLGTGLTPMLFAMIVGIPFYVCSTASVPIALGFMAAGLTPGAALVFLITGPATNAATFSTILKVLGKRTTFVYLATIAICALASGWILDGLFAGMLVDTEFHVHAHELAWHDHAASAVLLVILVASRIRRPKAKDCASCAD